MEDQSSESTSSVHLTAPARPLTNGLRVAGPVAGALTLVVSVILLASVWLLARPVALLLAAVILANALDSIVSVLARRLPRGAAIGVLYLVLVLILVVVGWVVLPPLLQQGMQAAYSLPQRFNQAQALLDQWGVAIPTLNLQSIDTLLAGTGSWVVSLPVTLVSSILQLVLVFGMSAYWLVVAPALRELVISLVPPDRESLARSVLGDIGQTMGGYVRGTVINAAIVGLLVYVGLLLIGSDYPLALGGVAAVGEVVPYLGPSLAALPAIAIALLDSPTKALIVLAFYVVLQQVENQVLVPLVMRQQTQMPPVLVIFAIAAGGTLGGVLGALVSVPAAGALLVLCRQVLVPAIRSWTGRSGASPAVEPIPR